MHFENIFSILLNSGYTDNEYVVGGHHITFFYINLNSRHIIFGLLLKESFNKRPHNLR